MSSFTTELHVVPVKDTEKYWRLVYGFTYRVGSEKSKNKIKVPRNFVTDFASVPKFMWSFIGPWGTHGKAAVVHDYLYQTKQCKKNNLIHKMFCGERAYADSIFLEAMEVLNVPFWRRTLMFIGVRVFGWLAWKSLKERMHKEMCNKLR